MTVATLALAAALAAMPPTGARLDAALDPAAATVGDRVRVEVELALPAAPEAAEPPALELGEAWGEAEVLDRPAEPTRIHAAGEAGGDPVVRYRWTFEIAAFRPGTLRLPPLTAVAPGPSPLVVVMDASPTLEIRSVLPAEGEVEPRPPTAPAAWPGISPWWWIAGGLALLALLASFYFVRRRRQASGPFAVKRAPSPFERLVAEVESILAEDDPETVHTRLSLASRRYLEGVLGFPAAEHTTREIRRDLGASPLPVSLQRGLVELLERCDEVKFAGHDVALEAARGRARHALDLTRSVEDAMRPATPAEEEAA